LGGNGRKAARMGTNAGRETSTCERCGDVDRRSRVRELMRELDQRLLTQSGKAVNSGVWHVLYDELDTEQMMAMDEIERDEYFDELIAYATRHTAIQ
jgi:hypothetical protein